jgi:hypothetical protein
MCYLVTKNRKLKEKRNWFVTKNRKLKEKRNGLAHDEDYRRI